MGDGDDEDDDVDDDDLDVAPFSCPAHPISEVVDTLGAGDTFTAALVHYLNRNLNEIGGTFGAETTRNGLEFACRIAGQKCAQKGLVNLKFEA